MITEVVHLSASYKITYSGEHIGARNAAFNLINPRQETCGMGVGVGGPFTVKLVEFRILKDITDECVSNPPRKEPTEIPDDLEVALTALNTIVKRNYIGASYIALEALRKIDAIRASELHE